MFKKLLGLANTYVKYFQHNEKLGDDVNSNIVSYPMLHISVNNKTENLSWNLDFQYIVKTKNKDNKKLSLNEIPGYIGITVISDIDRVIIDNVSYVIYIKEVQFDRSHFNRSELLPCIFEATSKYNHFPADNPRYPDAVRVVIELYHQCLYYPKLVDDSDFDYYKADEILGVTLNSSCDYSSGTKFNDKYFIDNNFLHYDSILKRNLPSKYNDVILKIIKERKR